MRVFRHLILCLCLCPLAGAQRQTPPTIEEQPDKPFPSTPKQLDDLLKADHRHNLKDLDEMARLVEEVQLETRKHAHYVISLPSVKKLEQIEKLSRAVRGRMRRD